MDEKCYSEEFIVKSYECDIRREMTPGAVLRRAQQVATDQCDMLGLTAEIYDRTHTAFLLSKQTAEFYAPIPVGRRIRIETRPSAPQRAVYYRFTALYDAETGERLCAVDSRWVLVNTQTRRILRTAPEEFPAIFTQAPPETLDLSIKKQETGPAVTLKALYSRCDQNGHINNAAYADIVCDFVPDGRIFCSKPLRLVIAYHREIPMDTVFEMGCVQTQENRWYFCGGVQGERNFEADLTLKTDDTGIRQEK